MFSLMHITLNYTLIKKTSNLALKARVSKDTYPNFAYLSKSAAGYIKGYNSTRAKILYRLYCKTDQNGNKIVLLK